MRQIFDLLNVNIRNNMFEKRNKLILDKNINIDIVLFGDSITESFNIPRFYPTNKAILNSGIGGDQLHVMEKRFHEDCLIFNPKTVIFMGGVNDVRLWKRNSKESEDYIINYITQKIYNIAKKCDELDIQLVMCTITKNNEFDLDPVYLNVVIDKINNNIKNICKEFNLDLIDYNEVLVDDTGLLSLNLCSDGLHPNHNGYFKMVKLIEKYL